MSTPRKEWDRHLILAELRRRKMTLAGIAEKYGFSESAVKNLWTRPHEKAERSIADFIGVDVETLFKDRYPKVRGVLDPNNLKTTRPASSPRQAA